MSIREMMETHIEASKMAARSHDWYDALNYLTLAARYSVMLKEEEPNLDEDDIVNTLCRTIGVIGGEMSECDSTLNQES